MQKDWKSYNFLIFICKPSWYAELQAFNCFKYAIINSLILGKAIFYRKNAYIIFLWWFLLLLFFLVLLPLVLPPQLLIFKRKMIYHSVSNENKSNWTYVHVTVSSNISILHDYSTMSKLGLYISTIGVCIIQSFYHM